MYSQFKGVTSPLGNKCMATVKLLCILINFCGGVCFYPNSERSIKNLYVYIYGISERRNTR